MSIKKIAEIANVGTATVDRVLYYRKGVRKETKVKVLNALSYLENGESKKKNILLLCQSGSTYNDTLKDNIKKKNYYENKINLDYDFILTKDSFSSNLENKILNTKKLDGLIVISTENKRINNIVNTFVLQNKPVITLTSDLSDSNRHAYVGNDQVAAGSTAAKLLTSSIKHKKGAILMIISQPFRCQQERELGFKKILRYEFPKLKIKEAIQTTDTSEESYKHIKRYIKDNGPPLGIYNITGGNLGVADALKESGYKKNICFVGHELNKHTKKLLTSDQMDYVIGHDVGSELKSSISLIENYYKNKDLNNIKSNIQIYNKYNCNDEEHV